VGATKSDADLYDPRRGDEALVVRPFRSDGEGCESPRTNRFAVYRLESGSGSVAVDAAVHEFGPGSMLFLSPYRRVRFGADGPVVGEVAEFHANFLCVETFHAEVGCAGVLFNDPYGSPVLALDDGAAAEARELYDRIRREQDERGLAHQEASLAYLKLLLILATRRKTPGGAACAVGAAALRHPVLAKLVELIEASYRTSRSPAEYAEALHMTPKTLGRIVREHLGTTLTDLIRDRVLSHAKWQLLHTLRPVKAIAREVGFADELYFSRAFKKAVGLAPTEFREFETAIRGGSNLSMTSGGASIPGEDEAADNPHRAGDPGDG
jgi:AraC-like DNA-binding protein